MTQPVLLPNLNRTLDDIEERLRKLEMYGPTSLAGGGGGAPTGAAGGVLAGTYPNPSFAVDMATQTELNTEKARIDANTTGITTNSNAITAIQADARWTDSRVPKGPAGGVLNGTYPNPGFAQDMATQAELDAAVAAIQADARWTNSRTPTGIAGGDLAGTYPNPAIPAASRVVPRTAFTLVTGSLAAAAQEVGAIALGKTARIMRITTDRPARVRLYMTAVDRDAAGEAARAATTDPADNSGVILDATTAAGALTIRFAPQVFASNFDSPVVSNIYYRVDNLDSVTGAVTVTIDRAVIE